MDKLKHHQKIVVDLLKSHLSEPSTDTDGLKDILVCDYESSNFQLLTTGWEGRRYVFIVSFHFHIKPNGKIWLLVNNTDIPIAEELVTNGISRHDIVLGFQAPQVRAFTAFAAA